MIKLLKKLYWKGRAFWLWLHKVFLFPFRRISPISRKFGGDRGTPIVRYYIKKFLATEAHLIQGDVLEMSEPIYTKKFGTAVRSSAVLHLTADNPHATIVADLTNHSALPTEAFDCFICTQTLQFIYDFDSAIAGSYAMLKPGGVMLATVNGISQISRYDMDQWGEYWRWTTLSALTAFEKIFGAGNVSVDFYGNCLSSVSALKGISAQELTSHELDFKDRDYEFLITIVARKNIK